MTEPTTDFFKETLTDLEKCHTVTTLILESVTDTNVRSPDASACRSTEFLESVDY